MALRFASQSIVNALRIDDINDFIITSRIIQYVCALRWSSRVENAPQLPPGVTPVLRETPERIAQEEFPAHAGYCRAGAGEFVLSHISRKLILQGPGVGNLVLRTSTGGLEIRGDDIRNEAREAKPACHFM
jgi:hypothetical protein